MRKILLTSAALLALAVLELPERRQEALQNAPAFRVGPQRTQLGTVVDLDPIEERDQVGRIECRIEPTVELELEVLEEVQIGAIGLGALLLTSWDFVLDPAMSQTALPFWYWHQPGAFFGMPYQNFVGWMGTGAVFMSVAALIWRPQAPVLRSRSLDLPLAIYLGNFAFAAVMSIGAGFWIPLLLGLLLGVLPAVTCWKLAQFDRATPTALVTSEVNVAALDEPIEQIAA